jgi:FAD:protein FMN transferase
MMVLSAKFGGAGVSESMSGRVEKTMGTTVRLDIYDDLPSEVLDQAFEQAFGWLRLADPVFSTARVDSQVSALDEGLLSPGRAAPLVRQVLNVCARLNDRTEGYFDVHTAGRLDPSRYVRGWALQRASAILTESAVTNHRLIAGSDVTCSGRPGHNHAWRIGVRNPISRELTTWALPATGLAVSTCYNHHGKQHIRDPLLRCPASGAASVTVAGPDLGLACAYATAAVAMGQAALNCLPSPGQLHVPDHRQRGAKPRRRPRPSYELGLGRDTSRGSFHMTVTRVSGLVSQVERVLIANE